MSLLDWQSWPLGPVPLGLTLWGFYWLALVWLQPHKNWLKYENSNSFAVYSIAGTIAVVLAYAIRHWLMLPPYVLSYVNWLPVLVTILTYAGVDAIERLMKQRLGYLLSTEYFFRLARRVRQKNSAETLRARRRRFWALFIGIIGIMLVAVVNPDSNELHERRGYFWLIKTLLGNIHMQTGLTWGLSCMLAMLMHNAFAFYLTGRETQKI